DHLRPTAHDYARRRILFTGASAVDGASGNRGECRALIGNHNAARRGCPVWIISGHSVRVPQCPLYPQKQILRSATGKSALCQKRTLDCPQSGLKAISCGQKELSGCLRNSVSSGVEFRPSTPLRCGKRPNRSTIAL